MSTIPFASPRPGRKAPPHDETCGLGGYPGQCPGCLHDVDDARRLEAAEIPDEETQHPTWIRRSMTLACAPADVQRFADLPPQDKPARAGELLCAEDVQTYRARRTEAERLAELMAEHSDLFAPVIGDVLQEQLAGELAEAVRALVAQSLSRRAGGAK